MDSPLKTADTRLSISIFPLKLVCTVKLGDKELFGRPKIVP